MNNYTLEALISDQGFIHFQHATLVINSNQDWYISILPTDEKDDFLEPKTQLELILETEDGQSFVTKGEYVNDRIDGRAPLLPIYCKG